MTDLLFYDRLIHNISTTVHSANNLRVHPLFSAIFLSTSLFLDHSALSFLQVVPALSKIRSVD